MCQSTEKHLIKSNQIELNWNEKQKDVQINTDTNQPEKNLAHCKNLDWKKNNKQTEKKAQKKLIEFLFKMITNAAANIRTAFFL